MLTQQYQAPPASVVHVHRIGAWWRPESTRRTTRVEWHEHLTVADVLMDGEGCETHRIVVNGRDVGVTSARVLAGDHVYVLAPAEGDRLKKAAAAVAAAFAFPILATGALAYLAVEGIRSVASFLFPSLDLRTPNVDDSNTYGWSGPVTGLNVEGLPIPSNYGEHDTGGLLVSAYPETVGGEKPQTYLHMLLLLGAGPIESVGGITADADHLSGDALPEGMLIEGNAAENYNEVRVSLRLGAEIQTPMPGFGSIKTLYDVNLPIENNDGGSGIPPVTDWSLAAVYDMPAGTEADRGEVRLLFPKGLFQIDSGGNLLKWAASIQVRYIELDGDGNPVGDYVVATGPDPLLIGAKSTQPYPYVIPFTFFNDDTYVPATASNAIQLESSQDHYAHQTWPLTEVPSWAAGNVIDEIMVVLFFRCRNSKAHNPLFAIADWDEDEVDPHVEGIMVELRESAPGLSDVVVIWGEGTGGGDATQEEVVGQVADDEWTMLAVTYEDDERELTVYINTQKVATIEHGVPEVVSTSYGSLLLGTLPNKEGTTSGTWHADIDIDEFRIYDRITSASLIYHRALTEGGGVSSSNLVLGYHLDSIFAGPSGDETGAFAPSSGAYVLTVEGDVTPTIVEGIVLVEGTEPSARARYRIEVQRTDNVQDTLDFQDTVRFDGFVATIDDAIGYSGCAMLGLRVLMSDQLSGIPQVRIPVKWRNDLPIWDGLDATSPTFTRDWSANPAWVFAAIHLDDVYGAGHVFDASSLDWPALLSWADWNDDLVYDQRGRQGGAGETSIILSYLASGAGMAGEVFVIRLPKPTPSQYVVGKWVRLYDLSSGSPWDQYQAGDYEIGAIVSVDSDTYELWCDWPDGIGVPSNLDLVDANAMLQGIEERNRCDIILGDVNLPFLEARNLVAECGDAMPVTLGDKVSVNVQRPRQPVAAYNEANIIRGSMEVVDVRREEGFNAAGATIQDKRIGYERTVITRDHTSLQGSSGNAARIYRQFDFRGVVRASQAHRRVDRVLREARDRVTSANWEAGADSIFAMPGDVAAVAHSLPGWFAGGRAAQTSADGSELWIDVPATLLTANEVERVDDLSSGKWVKASDAGSAPTITGTALADPDSDLVADEITFDNAATNPRVEQGVPHRGVGHQATATVWARVASGTNSETRLELVGDSETVASTTIAATTTWTRFTATGTATAADPELRLVIRMEGAPASDVVLEVCRQRLIHGADDGEDAVYDEAVVDHTAHTVMVRRRDMDSSEDEILVFATTTPSAGSWPAGSRIPLAESLGYVPQEGDVWALGTKATGTHLFELTGVGVGPDMRARLEALVYLDSVYRDPDDFEELDPPVQPDQTEAASVSSNTPPAAPSWIDAREEVARAADSGAMTSSLIVSWTLDQATANRVARTRIWLREDDGEWEQVHEAAGAASRARVTVPEVYAGQRLHVTAQPISRSGVGLGTSALPQATVDTYGVATLPTAPSLVRAYLAGTEATYEVELDLATWRGCSVEITRGGTFCGSDIARVPAAEGRVVIGPTSDWCVLPAAADGRASPPLYARAVLPSGARGEPTMLAAELDTSAFRASIDEDSWEDGPWATATSGHTVAPVLRELEQELHDDPEYPYRLHFDPLSSEIEGSYDSTVYAFGRPRHVHISVGHIAHQLPPSTTADLGHPLASVQMRSFSPQGHFDPVHPGYGRVRVYTEWKFSTSSDTPAGSWVPFRCGVFRVQSFKVRTRIVRPDTTWDIHVTRGGVSVRPMPEHANEAEVTS